MSASVTPDDFSAVVVTLTPFQHKVLATIEQCRGMTANTWAIAQIGFPEQWKQYGSRGGLIASIQRAAQKMQEKGIVAILPAKDRFGAALVTSRRPQSTAKAAGHE